MSEAEEGCAGSARSHHARGFSLVELMVGVSLTLILASASASLLGDFMATQKTLRVANQANTEITRLLRDIRRSFQASEFNGNENRACLLEFLNGDVNSLSQYQCKFDAVGQGGLAVAPAGVGFQLKPTVNRPEIAFVNVCEPIAGIAMPSGKGGRLLPPRSPREEISNWGGANQICPAACPAGQRPAVRFLTAARGNIAQRQFPRQAQATSDLNLWGGVLCASYFEDQTRQIQNLFGTNAGAFKPAFLTVTAFIARGRFDVLAPITEPGPPPIRGSNYVWVHGGLLLEYNESQEMSTFKN